MHAARLRVAPPNEYQANKDQDCDMMPSTLVRKPSAPTSRTASAAPPLSTAESALMLNALFQHQQRNYLLQLDAGLHCLAGGEHIATRLELPPQTLQGNGFRRILTNRTQNALRQLMQQAKKAYPAVAGTQPATALNFSHTPRVTLAVEAIMRHPSGVYLCWLTDIGRERQLEEECRVRRQESEQATQSRDDFLAYVNHELRTPLNAIIGFSQMMESGLYGSVSNPRYRDYIRGIRQSGMSLLQTVNLLLEMASMEHAHKSEQAITLTHWLETACVQHTALAFQHNVRLVHPSSWPNLTIRGQQGRLVHAVARLIGAAILHSAHDSDVRIRTSNLPSGLLRVEITDSGTPRTAECIRQILHTSLEDSLLTLKKTEEPIASYVFAREVARQHQGRFTLLPGKLSGNTALFILPACRVSLAEQTVESPLAEA